MSLNTDYSVRRTPINSRYSQTAIFIDIVLEQLDTFRTEYFLNMLARLIHCHETLTPVIFGFEILIAFMRSFRF